MLVLLLGSLTCKSKYLCPGVESALGNCYAGPPELGGCGGTKLKIFGGGGGSGGSASAIIGGIIRTAANPGRGITGSLIGVDLVNGGGIYIPTIY